MFGLLPDLTPRDSHSIWYTSSRRPVTQVALLDGNEQRNNPDSQQQQHGSSSRRAAQLLIERSALARLRADEQLMERRKTHIQNFGSGWLKPPAVPKTLHQMREEEKEQKEHAEAMRREQLAQELADAEAGGQDVLEDGGTGDLGADLDAEEEEVHDLDDDIPDADDSFGFDGGDDSAAEEGLSGMTSSVVDPSSDDDDEDRDTTPGPEYGQAGGGSGGGSGSDHDNSRREELVEERMRMADDAYRQAMARGQADGEDIYGGDEDLEAEGGGHMLDEEDIVGGGGARGEDEDDLGMGMDMDADLDDEIPEAGELSGLADLSGVYEHTDSEVDLSSSIAREPSSDEEEEEEEDEDEDISFAGPRAAPLMAPPSPTGRRGGGGGGGPRSSMDLSGLLSGDSSMMDSSMMHSSPVVRAQRR